MRKILLTLLFVTLFHNAYGQVCENKPPTIEVSGSAEIFVQPDEVTISLDITKLNKDLQIAKKEADTALSQVIDLTKRFSVKAEDVKTRNISVEMKNKFIRDPKNRTYDEDGEEIGTKVFLGYQVSTSVNVRMTDISRFQGFLDEVLRTGISEVNNVSFESSELRKYKDKARELAMKAAYEKASAMAGAINQTIGKAILIKEGKFSSSFTIAGGALSSNTFVRDGIVSNRPTVVTKDLATFSPGTISISAEVSVVFLLN
ncbi:MAG: SIMPL domain-containing protein [Chloracidobacterium sp.]|nr:SIMPL domain-containing protein [Chloracidobacterium sp.]